MSRPLWFKTPTNARRWRQLRELFAWVWKFPADVAVVAGLGVCLANGSSAAHDQSVAPPVNDEKELGEVGRLPLVVYSRHYGMPCYGDYVPTLEEVRRPFLAALAALPRPRSVLINRVD